jgi:hypothetical protein
LGRERIHHDSARIGYGRQGSERAPVHFKPRAAQALHEELHCARRDGEPLIREQFMLFANRTGAAYLAQERLRQVYAQLQAVPLAA